MPLWRFLAPSSIRWVVRHRAWTPYHLVRYWRFLVLRLRHPHVVTEGMVYLGRRVELTARKGYGRIVLGRWVHIGDGNRLRAHEGTLRIGTDIPRLANFILASFEGALMMGKLHRDAELMASVVDELKTHLVHYRVV